MDRANLVTFKGNPMTLTGQATQPGDTAPDFTATGLDLKPVRLSDFKGQTLIISSVPSLDTPVCSIQTRRFNQDAANHNAAILTISEDLPFAQKRWCGANDVTAVKVVSDYKDREFGQVYGLYIKELGLLARAVTVVGPDGKIVYQEIVSEMTEEPNYEKAYAAVDGLKK